jgi:hypothetical protein
MGGASADKSISTTKTSQPEIPSWMLKHFSDAASVYGTMMEKPGNYVYGGPRVAELSEGQKTALGQTGERAAELRGQDLPGQASAYYSDTMGGGGYQTPETMRSAYEQGAGPGEFAAGEFSAGAGPAFGAFQAGTYQDPSQGYRVGEFQDPYAAWQREQWRPDYSWENMATTGAAAPVVGAMSAPLFQRMRQETIPALRTQSQLTGQGLTSTRRGLAEQEAMETFGTALGTGVVAPIFTAERGLEAQRVGAERGLESTQWGGERERQLQAQTAAGTRSLGAYQTREQEQAALARAQAAGAASAYGAAQGAAASAYGARTAAEADVYRARTGAEAQAYGARTAAEASAYNTLADYMTGAEQRNLTQEENAMIRSADIYNRERANQVTLFGQGTKPYEMAGAEMQLGLAPGAIEQQQRQNEMDAAQAKFDEHVARQTGAAQAIFGATPYYTPQVQTTAVTKPSTLTQMQMANQELRGTVSTVAGAMGPMMMCWVADALFGKGSLDAALARIGVAHTWPRWALALYRRFGQWAAQRPRIVSILRPVFARAVATGRWLVATDQVDPRALDRLRLRPGSDRADGREDRGVRRLDRADRRRPALHRRPWHRLCIGTPFGDQ